LTCPSSPAGAPELAGEAGNHPVSICLGVDLCQVDLGEPFG
jgi:hypothetical protein